MVVKKLRPEDMTGRFMQENEISKINGAKCRTDLETPVQNVLAAEKCAVNLDTYLTNFITFGFFYMTIIVTMCTDYPIQFFML